MKIGDVAMREVFDDLPPDVKAILSLLDDNHVMYGSKWSQESESGVLSDVCGYIDIWMDDESVYLYDTKSLDWETTIDNFVEWVRSGMEKPVRER